MFCIFWDSSTYISFKQPVFDSRKNPNAECVNLQIETHERECKQLNLTAYTYARPVEHWLQLWVMCGAVHLGSYYKHTKITWVELNYFKLFLTTESTYTTHCLTFSTFSLGLPDQFHPNQSTISPTWRRFKFPIPLTTAFKPLREIVT